MQYKDFPAFEEFLLDCLDEAGIAEGDLPQLVGEAYRGDQPSLEKCRRFTNALTCRLTGWIDGTQLAGNSVLPDGFMPYLVERIGDALTLVLEGYQPAANLLAQTEHRMAGARDGSATDSIWILEGFRKLSAHNKGVVLAVAGGVHYWLESMRGNEPSISL